MSVILTQPVAGLRANESYSGVLENWLLAYGYARRDGDTTDKVDVTAPLAEHDPTLAENREAPGEDVEVKGEALGGDENASEVLGESNVPVVRRSRVLGQGSSEEAIAQALELDGSVDPEDVTEKAPSIVGGDEPQEPAGDPALEPTAEPTSDEGATNPDAAIEAAEDEPAAGQSTPGAVEPTS